jgi:hypothetical protein
MPPKRDPKTGKFVRSTTKRQKNQPTVSLCGGKKHGKVSMIGPKNVIGMGKGGGIKLFVPYLGNMIFKRDEQNFRNSFDEWVSQRQIKETEANEFHRKIMTEMFANNPNYRYTFDLKSKNRMYKMPDFFDGRDFKMFIYLSGRLKGRVGILMDKYGDSNRLVLRTLNALSKNPLPPELLQHIEKFGIDADGDPEP